MNRNFKVVAMLGLVASTALVARLATARGAGRKNRMDSQYPTASPAMNGPSSARFSLTLCPPTPRRADR